MTTLYRAPFRSAGHIKLVHVFIMIAMAISAFASCDQATMAATENVSKTLFTVGVSFLAIDLMLFLKAHYTGLYLFEPFSIIAIAYVFVFFLAPLVQFSLDNTARYNLDVSPWGFKGTLVALGSFIAFFCGYELSVARDNKLVGNSFRWSRPIFYPIQSAAKQELLHYAYMIWMISYSLSLINWLLRGYGLAYVLSGGIGGIQVTNRVTDSYAFLSYFKYSLSACWMIIFLFGRSRPMKILLYVLTLSINFFGGARAALLIPILAPIVWLYVRKHESPSIYKVLIFVTLLVVLFAIVQTVRVGVREGTGFSLEGQTIGTMVTPFLAEIEDYKAYYALFRVFPSQHGFLFGSQMFGYSLITLIPRAIFPSKPDPPIHEIIYLILGSKASSDGVAYPCLGELYVEFGVPGCIVGMLLLGIILKKTRSCLHAHDLSLAMILYSVLYPALLHVVIRGYMPQNFTMLLFVLFPFVFFNYIVEAHPLAQPKEQQALR